MNFKFWNALLFTIILGLVACSEDSTEEMTPDGVDCTNINASYSNDIEPIISNSCALSGCHVAGFSRGDFTTYEGLKAKVDDGSVKTRAIDQMNMPPANSSGPTSLNDNQLELLTCWIEAGAPDN